MPERCYCIFEGGGAKGIAHVGVLRALERAGLELVGFAGTSAGSIVAALAAARYSADDIFGESSSLLDRLDLDPRNKSAGKVDWPIGTPKTLLGHGWRGMKRASGAPATLMCLAAAALVLPWLLHLSGVPALAAFFLAVMLGAATAAWAFWMAMGFASVRPLRDAVNQALALQVRHDRSSEPVTFAELQRSGGRPLRIIAANISTGKLVLFSAETTPDVAVADAVAASVCIPVVFEAWKVSGDLHFDGGLVSNLPAWAFDAERAADRDAWTAAIEISDTDYERPSGFGILRAAALTAVFGSSMLNTRGVERLQPLRLRVKLKLLEFDFDRSRAKKIIDDADKQCEQRLVFRIVDIPSVMKEVCGQIRDEAGRYIEEARREANAAGYSGRLRVGIYAPVDDDRSSLENRFSAGFDDSADERLRIPRTKSLQGLALRDGEPLYADGGEWLTPLSAPEDRWIRKAIWPRTRWCLCVPYEKEGREWVVWIDGDEPLGLDEELIGVTLTALAEEVHIILDEGLPKDPAEDDDQGEEREGSERPGQAAPGEAQVSGSGRG